MEAQLNSTFPASVLLLLIWENWSVSVFSISAFLFTANTYVSPASLLVTFLQYEFVMFTLLIDRCKACVASCPLKCAGARHICTFKYCSLKCFKQSFKRCKWRWQWSEVVFWSGMVPNKFSMSSSFPSWNDRSASRILNDGCDFTKVLNFLYGSANASRYSCAAGAYSFAISSGLLEMSS